MVDGVHDMGGMHGFGPVDPTAVDSSTEPWGNRLQVVAMLSRGVNRAGLEAIEPSVYLASKYHERWLLCAEQLLVESGAVSESDLMRWRETFEDDAGVVPPRTTSATGVGGLVDRITTTPLHVQDAIGETFDVGDRVRVKRMALFEHHRCPRYIRGAVGTVERVIGSDVAPGEPIDGAREDVFTVRFDSVDLWGDRADDGEPGYDVFIDLCDSYLAPPRSS